MKVRPICNCKQSPKSRWIAKRLFKFLTLVGLGLLITGPGFAEKAEKKEKIFRFHLFSEPASLSPLEQRNSSAGYVLSQIMAPLVRWQKGSFQPGLATACEPRNPKLVVCQLRKDLKYSNGSAVQTQDWLTHFNQILDPQNKSPLARELFDVVGAEERFQGQSKPPALGIRLRKNELSFQLKRPQREFIYRLTNPLLSPFRGAPARRGQDIHFHGLGPYQLASWTPGQKMRFEKNPHSPEGNPDRPPLEALFVSEDSVALKLYETQELQFLRRLPTLYIPKFESRKDFHKIDQVRFDYFGFSKRFREKPGSLKTQEALALAIPYDELQRLYSAKPRPGCFGLPETWTAGLICYDRNLPRARELIKTTEPKSLSVLFSQSVDDHRRAIEWLQVQLARDLGFQLLTDGRETKLFLERLDQREAPFFRRGVAPDRPTCAAVLENFVPGAPENFLDLDEKKINENLARLLESDSEAEKIRLCRESLTYLRDHFFMIPTGPIYFSVLASPAFTGWDLNELNQLDLKDLKAF